MSSPLEGEVPPKGGRGGFAPPRGGGGRAWGGGGGRPGCRCLALGRGRGRRVRPHPVRFADYPPRKGEGERRCNLFRQPRDALDALALRAELGMKGDAEAVQPRHALVERLRQVEAEFLRAVLQRVEVGQVRLVGLPEIECVGQPRAHHLAVAVDDLGAAVLRFDVGSQQEAVGELVRIAMRTADEALLVGADGQPDHLRRDVEIGFLERAHQHDRPFDQPRHLLEQALILDEVEPVGECEVAGVRQDDLLAPLGVDDDPGGLEFCHVVVEAANGDGVRRVEAVTEGDVAGADAVDLEVDDHGIGCLRAEGADDRLQRPHPAQRAGLRRCRSPAHRLRPGEGADHLRHQFGDDLFRRPAGLRDVGDVEVALLRIGMDMGLGD